MITTYHAEWATPAAPRHLVRVDISLVLVAEFVREDWQTDHVRISRDGIPRDAALVAAYIKPDIACLSLVFEHESFPEVMEGAIPPSQEPVMERVYCQEAGKTA